ncbi:MAG: bifunctional alpha,alpha-trehalose-phosphate synthase (UDP-forming)/trehalose-phosphatase [Planctomycetes bacterium]|nr:bifunctional alpha,alpha-trehalose-phosphate synthase (UDP-forming)/trehalose-phosphatase [Planctomycetota bacterium]
MQRILLVSNRLPVTVTTEGGLVEVKRSLGGLATGLAGPHERTGGVWIGWPGALDGAKPEERPAIERALRAQRLVPIELSKAELAGFYEGFSNGVLWPLFHYMLGHVGHASNDWDTYVAVNRRYAELAAAEWKPGDLVWVHDYQLLLVSGFLRELVPDARIGFFLHIPFPSSAVFRGLPHARDVLRGVLGADLIGFHTASYLRHFAGSVLRLLGVSAEVDRLPWKGRDVHLGVFPMGVDALRFQELARSEVVRTHVRELRPRPGEQLMLGIDRLDYTKGLPRRLRAFERMLELHPELRERVRLIQVAVPSRGGVGAYQELRERVDGLVGRINGAFGTPSWTPVTYLQRGFDAAGVTALCCAADVALVTPIRDGMNLVAKEFVACRHDEDGVLVLSELAGAAQELGDALTVNPYDVDEAAEVYFAALRMPKEERRRRMRAMRERVFTHDVHHWAAEFLEHLAGVEGPDIARGTPNEPLGRADASQSSARRREDEALSRVAAARELVILLDYDGTLRRFEVEPGLAAPDPELLELLEGLARRERTEVHLVSGRPRADLDRWFARLSAGLHAEHGLWSRFPGEAWTRARFSVPRHFDRIARLLQQYAERVRGAFVERKDVTLVFHWRAAALEFGARQVNELRQHLSEVCSGLGVQLLPGDRVLEVRPAGLSKALAADRIAARSSVEAFFLAVGDDRTDEDLFAALPERALGVHVGGGPTRATLRLSDVGEARAFLRRLSERK